MGGKARCGQSSRSQIRQLTPIALLDRPPSRGANVSQLRVG